MCKTCKNVSTLKFAKLPCLRYKITEVKLFKPGQVPGLEWTSRWSNSKLDDISTWSSREIKTIHVTEGYSGKPLVLQVRQFVPLDCDRLERSWVDQGVKKSVEVPPYALADIAVSEKALRNHISQEGACFFNGVLKNKDKLLVKTYAATIRATQDPQAVSNFCSLPRFADCCTA